MQTNRHLPDNDDRQAGHRPTLPEKFWPALNGTEDTGGLSVEWILDWENHKERETP